MVAIPRTVRPEALDSLAEDAPEAMRSRRDLQRINRAMGARRIVARALVSGLGRRAPRRVVELGAGDGTLMLRVARTLAPRWPGVGVTLLDRQRLVSTETLAAFRALGWTARTETADVLEWAARPAGGDCDAIVANLFVHHFDDEPLAGLLAAIAARTRMFCACEPRRERLALVGSRLVGCLGANAVTRADAVLSVHAGFRGRELSALWPQAEGHWTLNEHSAGLFSHCFVAVRERDPTHE